MSTPSWIATKGYYAFADYLRERFGCRVHKVSLHAGFTCPNRDGRVGWGGCIYCINESFNPQAMREGENAPPPPIREQLHHGIEYMRSRYGAEKFFAYFQAFTNTYAPIERLKQVYDEGISHPDVIGLSIGTRPDCVPDEVLELIASYVGRVQEVWVEYGLQTIHDRTLRLINRGHDFEAFVTAVERTRPLPIKICAHVILGLPDESWEDMMATAEACAELRLDGIKLHHLYIARNTPMEKMYREGRVRTFTASEYVSVACDFLERLPPTTTVQRLVGDTCGALLVAPIWPERKGEVFAAITREFKRRGTYQGARWGGRISLTSSAPEPAKREAG